MICCLEGLNKVERGGEGGEWGGGGEGGTECQQQPAKKKVSISLLNAEERLFFEPPLEGSVSPLVLAATARALYPVLP